MVKVLTLQHPWVWCIFHAGKDVENRTWMPYNLYPGQWLLIHGGKPSLNSKGKPNQQVQQDWAWIFKYVAPKLPYEQQKVLGQLVIDHHGYEVFKPLMMPGIVGMVWFEGVQSSDSPWAVPGQCHWKISNPILFDQPHNCKGQLGLWDCPEEYLPYVLNQIRKASDL